MDSLPKRSSLLAMEGLLMALRGAADTEEVKVEYDYLIGTK
jgi:hypothetical protein